jgi:hypothetical protein
MAKAIFDIAGKLDLLFRIARVGSKTLSFVDSDDVAYPLDGLEFELNVKERPSSETDLFQLTSGAGLTVGTSSIEIEVDETQTDLPEKLCFWELYETVNKKTWLCGNCYFISRDPSSEDDALTATVRLEPDTITVTISNPVSASESETYTSDQETILGDGVDTPWYVAGEQFDNYGAAQAALDAAIAADVVLQTAIDGKQATLVSATNIKTINGSSVLGAGDLVVSGGWGLTGTTTLTGSVNVTSPNASHELSFSNKLQIAFFYNNAGGGEISSIRMGASDGIGIYKNISEHNIQLAPGTNDTTLVQDALTITSLNGSFEGAKYANDYSLNFIDDRSIPDIGYVNTLVSDVRLKENIEPVPSSIELIQRLKPCTFTMKATGEHKAGFIAQEMEEVFPEMVIETKEGIKKIKRDQLIP